ncbi:MAG: cyclic nucleotide-binding and patatin-like phospholipase domain-containing protein [Bacteroidota bacterium]
MKATPDFLLYPSTVHPHAATDSYPLVSTITDKSTQDIAQVLSSISYFQHLSQTDLMELIGKTQLLHLVCGEALVRQGEESDHAYILLDGRLKTTIQSVDGRESQIGEIGQGEMVGETGVLLNQKRSATVTALRDCMLMVLTRDALIDSIKFQSESITAFTQTVLDRSKPTFAYRHQIASVLVFPISPSVQVQSFCRQLSQALASETQTKFLSKEIFVAETGQACCNETVSARKALNAKLAVYESQHSVMVYMSEGKWDAWTQGCASRVDKVILVGKAGQSEVIGKEERQLLESLTQKNQAKNELVLIHPNKKQLPKATSKWTSPRPLTRHHHLVEGDQADFQKLARFITGKAIGLALSGGGFKATMQGGIIQAMLEGGIPLDIIGGSSGGAFSGAYFAKNPPLEETYPAMLESIQRFKKSMKLTLPIVSLYSGKNFTKVFQEMMGETEIEDLWTNFFCLSLSLVSGQIMVHQEGKLWEATRASSAVMGLVPPVIKDGDCLVDGGFINPCPTDILHRLGAGKIIVLSAFGKAGIDLQSSFSPSVSGWQILKRMLNPFSKQKAAPNMGTNIVQSMLMASTHLLNHTFDKSKIDLLIQPDVSSYRPQDKSAMNEMYEYGYNYGQQHLPKWKSALGIS